MNSEIGIESGIESRDIFGTDDGGVKGILEES
jgi:hypothetical protein